MALVLAAGSEWLDHIWWGHTIDASLVLVDLILVMLAALTISWLLSNRRELISGFMGEISWRKRIPWILIVLGLWPLLVLASNTIAGRLGLPLSAGPVWPNKPLPLILTESLLWFALFGGPLNEEPGWRGFALPRLQGRFSPLVASIILGALWGLWHVPLHLMGVYGGGLWGSVIRLMDIPRAVLFTWVYNRTKGSLLIAILFHAAINTTSLFLPRSHHVVFVICFVVAAIVVLTDRMWKKLPGSGLADESA
jgi:membrane protease YdiL (CAAX protease family)